ncbi:hypothetical protein [Sphingomonas aerolata]|jgi:Tfp pilus assembly major pilin PilA|uniref:hypothetical protein n=1 Tax=Sphingomonas aerolata TaxID=185951 RepID=UPI002FE19F06
MQDTILVSTIDIKAVRHWCAENGVRAAITPMIYRNRIHHFTAAMSGEDTFLFRLRWT